MIAIKTPKEIQKMRIAGKLAAQVLDMIASHVKAGVTTEDLDQRCHDFIVQELNATPAPLGYKGYPKSICTSINHVVCHGIPSSKKILKTGDIINIDVTVIKDGYHGDTSKMFFIGKPSILAERLCRVTQECLYLGIEMVKPGNHLGDIGHAIQTHAEASGYSVVKDFCGHGIGRGFHEPPSVLHYGKPNTGEAIKPFMTFTIEPMINAGTHAVKILPDKWTVITKDRKLSAQYEHTICVTKTGCEILTYRAEETFFPTRYLHKAERLA